MNNNNLQNKINNESKNNICMCIILILNILEISYFKKIIIAEHIIHLEFRIFF